MEEQQKEIVESRQLAPMTPTEISQVTKQLGLATSAEIYRASKGIAQVLEKIALLDTQIAQLHQEITTRDVRMYPTKSEEIKELASATSKAKVMGLKQLVATGNLNNKEYYKLEDLVSAFSEPLDQNNLSLDFFMDQRNGIWVLVSRLEHFASGQWKETTSELNDTPVSTRMNDDQALSSSLTYKKRDAYRLLLGI